MDAKSIENLRERTYRPMRFEATVGARKFAMTYPNPFLERRLSLAVLERMGANEASGSQLVRDLVVASVTSWEGVTYHDLLGDNDDSALECNASTIAMVMDFNIEILDGLTQAMHDWRQARKQREDKEIKNSSSASTGSQTSESATTPLRLAGVA